MLYESRDEFLGAAVDFVRAGVDRGDAVVVATPRAAEVADALGAHRPAEVEIVDDRDWHQVPAWTIGSYARRAQRSALRGHGLRALAELRWQPGSDRAAVAANANWHRYEAVLNHALAELPVELCCAYDRSVVGDDVLVGAHCTHRTFAGDGTSATYVEPSRYVVDYPQEPWPAPPPGARTLRFAAEEIPAVRQETLTWARAAGMAEDPAQELLIAVYEVVSNAVEHGGGHGVGRFWQVGPWLWCEVTSQLSIADPLLGYRPPGTAQERGRGLWLVRQICEEVSIHNDGGAVVRLGTRVSRT